MFEISELIAGILNGSSILTNLGVKVQPVISSQETEKPIVNYVISEEGSVSKGNAFPYNITMRIYSENYSQTLQIVDAIKEAIGEAPETGFLYLGTQEPQPDVVGELYTETNYSYSFKN